MINKVQRTSVKALFERDGRVLLVKDPKGVWELPGGRIEHGEAPEEALVRELNEELGWTNVIIKSIIDAWSFSAEANETNYHFVILTYGCSCDEESIKENEEYTEYKWMAPSEIKNINMRDGYKRTINKFLNLTPSAPLLNLFSSNNKLS